ncbi:Sec-independent protein translocase protein TatB [Altericroceibacterium xinjiangense]|uniref:Sec-independent protein translocase protein TatB n=1 Tax=Altericroceibacterium xinjiangense TaxID=762261 RepID=UPI000F7D90FB|nr:Sec-independent protein translocase protein TatB [Altericroceibacterium xinjiangense]
MFDIGATELLLIVIVAVVVIGPKDLPLALRTAGRWIGKIRRVSTHFRTGLDAMVREAEMEDMERKWREQNARIMAEHPGGDVVEGAPPPKTAANPGPEVPAGAEARLPPVEMEPLRESEEPQLPLNTPRPPS